MIGARTASRLLTFVAIVFTAAAGAHAGEAPPGAGAAAGGPADRLGKSAVDVQGATRGSGVVVGTEGLVLTAAHVAGGAGDGCLIILPDGTRLVGIAVAVNSRYDFALVRIPAVAGLCAADTGPSTRVDADSSLIAFGCAGRGPGATLAARFGHRIAPPGGLERRVGCICSDIELAPGDSGGPLFDAAGRLVAIHVMVSRSGDTLYAVHTTTEMVRPVLAMVRRQIGRGPATQAALVGDPSPAPGAPPQGREPHPPGDPATTNR